VLTFSRENRAILSSNVNTAWPVESGVDWRNRDMDELAQWTTQLNGDDLALATEAAEKLGQIGGSAAQEALEARFAPYYFMSKNHEKDKLFFTIALVLAGMGRYHAYRIVLDEDAPFVRDRVKKMLESIDKQRAIDLAVAMYRNGADDERYWAREILAVFRSLKLINRRRRAQDRLRRRENP
jgi:hypothetical protein